MENSLSTMSLDTLVNKLIDLSVSFGSKLLVALLVFLIGRWIVKKLNRLVINILTKRHVEASLATFTKSLVSITLNFTLVIIIISVLGIETSSFIALFASAGVAIGMALSGTLQNFAGGVMILLFKPFKVGDYIEAQGQSGTVKEIQIFNTIITTTDNKVIIIPNGGLSTGIMMNYSKESQRRVDWVFGIGYGDSYEHAKAVITRLLDNDPRILKDPNYFIALTALNASSVDIVVRAWVKAENYWGVFFDMNEKVYKTFAEENLNIPFPQMDVHLYNEK
ncbi:MAG: mechanosensitive ion channel family protein [Odoribacter splanchnicus]